MGVQRPAESLSRFPQKGCIQEVERLQTACMKHRSMMQVASSKCMNGSTCPVRAKCLLNRPTEGPYVHSCAFFRGCGQAFCEMSADKRNTVISTLAHFECVFMEHPRDKLCRVQHDVNFEALVSLNFFLLKHLVREQRQATYLTIQVFLFGRYLHSQFEISAVCARTTEHNRMLQHDCNLS